MPESSVAELAIAHERGFGQVRGGDNTFFLAEQVELGMQVPYPPYGGASLKQFAQGVKVANSLEKIGETEAGDDPNRCLVR